MTKFKGYPKAYKRDTQTKLLYLYKSGIISHSQWQKARFFNAMINAKKDGKLADALIDVTKKIKEVKDCI